MRLSLNWRFVMLGVHTEKISFSNSLFLLTNLPSLLDMNSIMDSVLLMVKIWSIVSESITTWKESFSNKPSIRLDDSIKAA